MTEKIDVLSDQSLEDLFHEIEDEFPGLFSDVLADDECAMESRSDVPKYLGFSFDLMESDEEVVSVLNVGNTSTIERTEKEEA